MNTFFNFKFSVSPVDFTCDKISFNAIDIEISIVEIILTFYFMIETHSSVVRNIDCDFYCRYSVIYAFACRFDSVFSFVSFICYNPRISLIYNKISLTKVTCFKVDFYFVWNDIIPAPYQVNRIVVCFSINLTNSLVVLRFHSKWCY